MLNTQVNTKMPGGWRQLVRAKRKRAVYRITLTVRGHEIVKEYTDEESYRRWKATYEYQARQAGSGIEALETSLIYR